MKSILAMFVVLAAACGGGSTRSEPTTPIADPIPMAETRIGFTPGVTPVRSPEPAVVEVPVTAAEPVPEPVEDPAVAKPKPDPTADAATPNRPRRPPSPPLRVQIVVTKAGFEPKNITVPRNRPVILQFERLVERTCGTEIVMLVDGKKFEKDLPLNQRVELAVTFRSPGTVKYACAMDMIRGSITVQ